MCHPKKEHPQARLRHTRKGIAQNKFGLWS